MIPSTPPDPYTLKAIEIATKTAVELIHQDVKIGLSSLLQTIKERGAEKAKENVEKFDQALTEEMSQRFSVDITPDGYERISGNLNDPDFAYLVQQATISSARTSNQNKHKLLARAVTERMIAKSEGLVALSSSLACEIVPNLTSKHLNFLGLSVTVLSIRPDVSSEMQNQWDGKEQQNFYMNWLSRKLQSFTPFPKMKRYDYSHLESMSCLTFNSLVGRSLEAVLTPDNLPLFTWPEKFFAFDQEILNLREVFNDGLERCTFTTVGSLIGTHIHDLKLKAPPTRFTWDEE